METLFDDDFTAGWNAPGRRERWRLRPLPWLPEGDGRVTTSADGLCVTSTGTDPKAGPLAFAAAPRGHADPGHLRWAAFATTGANEDADGFPSLNGTFVAEGLLLAEIRRRGRAPDDSAVAALICVDRQSGMVLDFALTGSRVLVLYERLPGPDRGGFWYRVPVAERRDGQRHHCAVEVTAGQARWLLDGVEVFRVDRLGLPLADDTHLDRRVPGPIGLARPDRLTAGLGLLCYAPGAPGVRLHVRRFTVRRALGDA